MAYHKIGTDGPIVLTVTSAKLSQGPNPKYPPQLLLYGNDGTRDVHVPLSSYGAMKQFALRGVGTSSITGLPLDTEMPEYYGTWRLEQATLEDGSKATRVERVADETWDRVRDANAQDNPDSRPAALIDDDGPMPWDDPVPAPPEPQARPVAQRTLQPRLAPPPATVPAGSTAKPMTDHGAHSQSLYDRHMGFALLVAKLLTEKGYAVDINAIVATLMIDTQKRGG